MLSKPPVKMNLHAWKPYLVFNCVVFFQGALLFGMEDLLLS